MRRPVRFLSRVQLICALAILSAWATHSPTLLAQTQQKPSRGSRHREASSPKRANPDALSALPKTEVDESLPTLEGETPTPETDASTSETGKTKTEERDATASNAAETPAESRENAAAQDENLTTRSADAAMGEGATEGEESGVSTGPLMATTVENAAGASAATSAGIVEPAPTPPPRPIGNTEGHPGAAPSESAALARVVVWVVLAVVVCLGAVWGLSVVAAYLRRQKFLEAGQDDTPSADERLLSELTTLQVALLRGDTASFYEKALAILRQILKSRRLLDDLLADGAKIIEVLKTAEVDPTYMDCVESIVHRCEAVSLRGERPDATAHVKLERDLRTLVRMRPYSAFFGGRKEKEKDRDKDHDKDHAGKD